jgi:putative spermidine/putrescine transport system permease protein
VQAFFKVTLPLLRSSLVSGAIFAFIISFSDINLALFLSGPQSISLPVHIFSQTQWQGDPTIAAASSMQIVIIGLLILIVQRIFRLRLVVVARPGVVNLSSRGVFCMSVAGSSESDRRR